MKGVLLITVCIIFNLITSCEPSASPVTTKPKKALDYGDKCEPIYGYHNHTKSYSYVATISGPICNYDLNLECINKTCRCNRESVYDEDREICLSGIGAMCKPGSKKLQCIANASCVPENKLYSSIMPALLATTYRNLLNPHHLGRDYAKYYSCKCDRGFEVVRKPTEECRPTFGIGDTCSVNPKPDESKCDPSAGLICGNSGICICRDPKTMYYSKDLYRCVSPLGSKCAYDGRPNPCNKNAVCSSLLTYLQRTAPRNRDSATYPSSVHDDLRKPGHCICAPGFTENETGNCTGSFQVACTETSDCNTDSFLACVNGLCQCEHGSTQSFSVSEGAVCKIRLGGTCSKENGPTCLGNLICKKGYCSCKDGFSETTDGRCLMGHGTECSITVDSNSTACNHFQGLACIDDVCACFDSSLHWNAKAKVCAAKEGKTCGEVRIPHNAELLEDPFYPFANPINSTVFSYFVGCDNGHQCARDSTAPMAHHCQKIKSKDADEE